MAETNTIAVFVPLISCFLSVALAETSNMMVNRSGLVSGPCLIPNLGGKIFEESLYVFLIYPYPN